MQVIGGNLQRAALQTGGWEAADIGKTISFKALLNYTPEIELPVRLPAPESNRILITWNSSHLNKSSNRCFE